MKYNSKNLWFANSVFSCYPKIVVSQFQKVPKEINSYIMRMGSNGEFEKYYLLKTSKENLQCILALRFWNLLW